MTSIQLKCKLLSDIIISQSTATEGSQRTLDYIPGSSFLGLAASKLYNNGLDGEIAMQLFHNGKVIYGDAHPLINNTRALRIPSYWYIAKGETLREGIYPQHLFATRDGKQPKQCRTGYVVFNNDNTFLEYTPNHRFAIKSGYDRDKRRSKDEKMYGYQSLVEGSEWAFEISYDENSVNEDTVMLLINAIVGNQQIGKSKTAEYGQVEIKQEDFVSFNSTSDPGDHCLIYAESRLMFLDNDGQPTYKPTPEQLGINNGSINWAKSQIRTFQFAPFNSKRKTRDSERCVIEKGSVFYIDKLPGYEINEKMVGCFINEGFGKTIVNPGFLLTDEMGKIKYTCQPIEDMESFTTITEDIELSDENKSILSYLLKSRKTETSQTEIYRKVNKFI
ncbi:MAG: hypothetical protein Q8S18_11580, partial [Bacteroidales bacterium]|nr:hypothetical protein [Bacteroidales bacterium]